MRGEARREEAVCRRLMESCCRPRQQQQLHYSISCSVDDDDDGIVSRMDDMMESISVDRKACG